LESLFVFAIWRDASSQCGLEAQPTHPSDSEEARNSCDKILPQAAEHINFASSFSRGRINSSRELGMPERQVSDIDDPRSPGSTSRQGRGKSNVPDETFVSETADASPGSSERQSDDRQSGDAEDQPPDGGENSSQGVKTAFKKHSIAILVCGGLIVLGVVGGVVWYLHSRHYESTDDAFIDARSVLVSPQVTGDIISVNVTDDQIVKTGDLLVKIDARDYLAALHQADAQVRQAEAAMKNLEAQISAQEAQIARSKGQATEAQADLKFAEQQNARYQDLAHTGSGTVERALQAASDLKSRRAALDAADAATDAAQRQIDVLKTQMEVSAAQRDVHRAKGAGGR
jgi:membrane fusion protein, multidrug efflux system